MVHFHHFLTFGIDFVSVVRRVLPDCRIVFTFHEFLAICHADGHMVRRTDRSLCDHASQVRCHQCFPDRGAGGVSGAQDVVHAAPAARGQFQLSRAAS